MAEDKLSPAVRDAVSALAPGELSKPVAMGPNVQLFLLEERGSDEPAPYDEVARQVRSDCFRKALEEVRVQVAAELRKGAQISVDQEALKKMQAEMFKP
jgi:parvulin-like peptidyl-prolyl isomerase